MNKSKKLCKNCGIEILKKKNCSVKDWEERVKYCSKICMDKNRVGKPSVSPNTSYKTGHTLFKNDTRKKRHGNENHKWTGGKSARKCFMCKKIFLIYSRKNEKNCSLNCAIAYKKTEEFRSFMSKKQRDILTEKFGNLYKDMSALYKAVRKSSRYSAWRKQIFQRDNYQCLACGAEEQLQADHIKQFALILFQNEIKNFDEALRCEELWNVGNGRTLCFSCHRKTDSYAKQIKYITKI